MALKSPKIWSGARFRIYAVGSMFVRIILRIIYPSFFFFFFVSHFFFRSIPFVPNIRAQSGFTACYFCVMNGYSPLGLRIKSPSFTIWIRSKCIIQNGRRINCPTDLFTIQDPSKSRKILHTQLSILRLYRFKSRLSAFLSFSKIGRSRDFRA